MVISEGCLGFQHRPLREGDLVHWRRLCELDVRGIESIPATGSKCRGSAAEDSVAWDVCALLESFLPQSENPRHHRLWFRVPRGTVDDWMSIKEYRDYAGMGDCADEDVAAARQREWAERFPDKAYWHTLESNVNRDRVFVFVDGRAVVEVCSDGVGAFGGPCLRDTLEKLRIIAAELVRVAIDGTCQAPAFEEPPQCGEPAPELAVLSAELDASQVRVLLESLDIYMRMWMGQYDEVEWQMRYFTRDFDALEADKAARERKWLEMRRIVLPGISYMGLSGSYGIWNPAVCDRAQSAYDMKQVIRHAWAWHRNPEGGMFVDFDTPWIRGLLPAVGCECSGDGDEIRCSIRFLPAHARLVSEALGVWKCAVSGETRKLMEHYTDNEEALSIAAEIEGLMPTIDGAHVRNLKSCASGLIDMLETLTGPRHIFFKIE